MVMFGIGCGVVQNAFSGVGYLVVATGCRGLVVLSPRFQTARILCFIGAALWLVSVGVVSIFNLPQNFKPLLIMAVIAVLIDSAMIWQLLGAIRDFATAERRPDLASRAHYLRLAYIVMELLYVVLAVILVLNLGSTTPTGANLVVASTTAIILLIASIFILHLVHDTKVEVMLAPQRNVPAGNPHV